LQQQLATLGLNFQQHSTLHGLVLMQQAVSQGSFFDLSIGIWECKSPSHLGHLDHLEVSVTWVTWTTWGCQSPDVKLQVRVKVINSSSEVQVRL
jgi:hypothetical protein